MSTFPPGSPDAIANGCVCPILINGPEIPADQLLTAPDCVLHQHDAGDQRQ